MYVQCLCMAVQYMCVFICHTSNMYDDIVCVPYVCCWWGYVIYMGTVKCMCVTYWWSVCVFHREEYGV